MSLSQQEIERYRRHLLLPEIGGQGQQRLKDSKILVVGAGGLGCPILLGVSRKGFIGKLGHEPDAAARAPGSIAVGLAAIGQGVQFLRVHDVAETAQAVRLWQAVR